MPIWQATALEGLDLQVVDIYITIVYSLPVGGIHLNLVIWGVFYISYDLIMLLLTDIRCYTGLGMDYK